MNYEKNTMMNNPSPDLGRTLETLETHLAATNGRQKLILSDFDYTLCDRYVFDPLTNNHVAEIDADVVAAAQAHHLVVATSRRANNPTIPRLWQSGLVPASRPVIVENGGSIVSRAKSGELQCLDVARSDQIEHVHAARRLIENMQDTPADRQLVCKVGRTMLVLRLQDESGSTTPGHNQWLAERLRSMISSPALQVTDTRVSVTIQHADINKAAAFRTYLQNIGLDREHAYVIGMGDGGNDAEIFDEADLSLGFSDAVTPLVDLAVPHGVRAVPSVLGVIQRV